jgi:hypothetical protein
VTDSPQRAPAPISDLFASAVHRYGTTWADLSLGAVAALIASTGVVAAAAWRFGGGGLIASALLAYPVGYFCFQAWVMLRGLPQRAPSARTRASYLTAVYVGAIAGGLVYVMGPFAAAVAPLLLFAVPAVAAGDASAAGSLPRGVRMAVANFARAWAVWVIVLIFCLPIGISMFLIVSAFAGAGPSTLLGIALAVPIAWPFSALFVRALYGDLTGRVVVAPQDRTR